MLIDSVSLHNFVYFAVTTDTWKVYKAFGKPTDLKVKLVIDLKWYQENYSGLHGTIGPVMRLQSMDNYAFYITTADLSSENIWQWIPFLVEG